MIDQSQKLFIVIFILFGMICGFEIKIWKYEFFFFDRHIFAFNVKFNLEMEEKEILKPTQ